MIRTKTKNRFVKLVKVLHLAPFVHLYHLNAINTLILQTLCKFYLHINFNVMFLCCCCFIIVVVSHLHIPTVLPWFFAIFFISIFVFFFLLFIFCMFCVSVSLYFASRVFCISFLFTNSDTLQINTYKYIYDVRDGSIAVVTFHFTCLHVYMRGWASFFFRSIST